MRVPVLLRAAVVGLASALVLAFASPASAASPDEEHAAAVESFRRGTQLVELGKLQDAIEAFRQALAHEPSSVGARLDLADCYEKIGAPAQAWRQYALAAAYASAAGDARVAMARDSAAHLEPQLLRIKLQVQQPYSLETLDVVVDGEPVEREILRGAVLALAPGRHRIEAAMHGKQASLQEVEGPAGETRVSVIVFPRPPAAPVPAPAPPQSPQWPAQKTWAIVVGGIGVAGAAAGTVLGLVASSKKSTVAAEQNDPTIGGERFGSDLSDAKAFATASTVSFIAAGVALAAGLTLWLTAPSSNPSVSARASPGGGVLAVTW